MDKETVFRTGACCRCIGPGKGNKDKALPVLRQGSYDPARTHSPNYCAAYRAKHRAERGTITRTCRKCGKTFTLPENVQHWPDCCRECRAKDRPVEQIMRRCRGCGKTFTFPSNLRHWPNYCRECQTKRRERKT